MVPRGDGRDGMGREGLCFPSVPLGEKRGADAAVECDCECDCGSCVVVIVVVVIIEDVRGGWMDVYPRRLFYM